MKQMKGFVCGIIFAVCLMAVPALADSFEKTINVLTDYVTVEIDGETKDVRNFVHEGTTYIALRDVSELLGCEVGWDDATRTASITTGKVPVQEDKAAIEVNVVCTCQEHNVIAAQSFVTSHCVSCYCAVGMTDVQFITGIVNGCGDIEFFFSHNKSLLC